MHCLECGGEHGMHHPQCSIRNAPERMQERKYSIEELGKIAEYLAGMFGAPISEIKLNHITEWIERNPNRVQDVLEGV